MNDLTWSPTGWLLEWWLLPTSGRWMSEHRIPQNLTVESLFPPFTWPLEGTTCSVAQTLSYCIWINFTNSLSWNKDILGRIPLTNYHLSWMLGLNPQFLAIFTGKRRFGSFGIVGTPNWLWTCGPSDRTGSHTFALTSISTSSSGDAPNIEVRDF